MSIQVDPDWWKTLFDDVYLVTDARSVCDDEITCREVDVFCEMIPLEKGDRILDLCGGQGRHTLELYRRGHTNCTVFDYSDVLLKQGRQTAEKQNYDIEFTQGDARHTRFKDCFFHHVLLLGNSLGYIPETGADTTILKEACRILCQRGWLLLDVTDGAYLKSGFNPSTWHEIGSDILVCRQRELQENRICARELVLSKQNGLIRDKTYCIRLYDDASLLSMVADAGFTNARVHTGFTPPRKKRGLWVYEPPDAPYRSKTLTPCLHRITDRDYPLIPIFFWPVSLVLQHFFSWHLFFRQASHFFLVLPFYLPVLAFFLMPVWSL